MSEGKSGDGGGSKAPEAAAAAPSKPADSANSGGEAAAGGGGSKFLEMQANKGKKEPVPWDGSLFACVGECRAILAAEVARDAGKELKAKLAYEVLLGTLLDFERFLVGLCTVAEEPRGMPPLLYGDPLLTEFREKVCKAVEKLPRFVKSYTLKSKTAAQLFAEMTSVVNGIEAEMVKHVERLRAFDEDVAKAVKFNAETGVETWVDEATLWTQECRCKVDTNRHLEGSVPLDTMWRLQEAGLLSTSFENEEEMAAKISMQRAANQPERVADLMSLYQQAFANAAAARVITRDIVKAAYTEGVMLMELHFTPAFMCEEATAAHDKTQRLYPKEWDEYFECIVEGRELALEHCPGMVVGLVVDAMRQYGPAVAKMTANFAQRWRPMLCGFGLSGNETRHSCHDFESAIRLVYDIDLPLTVEIMSKDSSSLLVDVFNTFPRVNRITGAACIAVDDSIISTMLAKGTTVELVATTDLCSGRVVDMDEHHCIKLLKRRVPVAICSHWPALLGSTLVKEWVSCLTEVKLDKGDVLTMSTAAKSTCSLRKCPAQQDEAKGALRRATAAVQNWREGLQEEAKSQAQVAHDKYKVNAMDSGFWEDAAELCGRRAALSAATRVLKHPERAEQERMFCRGKENAAMFASSEAERMNLTTRVDGALEAADAAAEAAKAAFALSVKIAGEQPSQAEQISSQACAVASEAQQANLDHHVRELKEGRANESKCKTEAIDADMHIQTCKDNLTACVEEVKAAEQNVSEASQALLEAHMAKKGEAHAALLAANKRETDAYNARTAAAGSVVKAKEAAQEALRASLRASEHVSKCEKNVTTAIEVAQLAGIKVPEEIQRLV